MPAASAEQNNTEPRILVVDDSRVVRISVSRVLDQGFHVLQANDGKVGLERARKVKPDLVVTDIIMPNLDGYGLICALRGDDETEISEVPIIVMTSAEDDEVRERAYACGASAFILKPFDAAKLIDTVRQHLNDHNASADELAATYNDRIESVVVSDVIIPAEDD